MRKYKDIVPTESEIRTIELLSQGQTRSEIAEELHCSTRTIDSKVYRMQNKYGAKNTIHLVIIFVAEGWIDVKSDSNIFF